MSTTSEEPLPAASQSAMETILLRGVSVAPGMAVGPAIFSQRDLADIPVQRIPQDAVEQELNRLHEGLKLSTEQLEELRDKLDDGGADDQRPLIESQIARLKDSVFLADVENLILGEQMGLEGAIAKVILDFDRISRLVESSVLRERASELRDVGMRVLRNLEAQSSQDAEAAGSPSENVPGILVARELTVSEVLSLVGGTIRGVVTSEGSLTGQAAVFLRSLRIPALTGVDDLWENILPGDELLLDASEGCIHVRPDQRLLDQFEVQSTQSDADGAPGCERRLPAEITTQDGEWVHLAPTCGNLPEVESANALGMPGVGLYRTELLFLLERSAPGANTLEAHYKSVLSAAKGGPVVFRLADLNASMGLTYLHAEKELNPALGSAGIRGLLETPVVLRRQLEGILRAAHGYEGEVGIALPRVVDVSDLRSVRELLFEERYSLKRAGEEFREELQVGVVIETPAAVLGAVDFAREADFLAIGLDSLQQYLLIADRDEPRMSAYFEVLHPFVLRAVDQVVAAAHDAGTPLRVYGVTVANPDNLRLLLAAGLRHLCVSPAVANSVEREMHQISTKAAAESAARWRGLSAPDTWDAS